MALKQYPVFAQAHKRMAMLCSQSELVIPKRKCNITFFKFLLLFNTIIVNNEIHRKSKSSHTSFFERVIFFCVYIPLIKIVALKV